MHEDHDRELRREAEQRLHRPPAATPPGAPEHDRLLHELQVHQVELELQNAELRETQLEAERAGQRYRDLFDLAPIGYVGLDHNAVIVEANVQAARMLGVGRGQLVGRPFILHVPHDYQARFFQLRTSSHGEPGELELRRADGSAFWAELTAAEFTGTAACQTACVLAFADISSRKAAEEAMVRTQQVAALGTLVAGIAHEFNNLHAGIIGYLELILRKDELNDRVRERLEKVHQSAHKAHGITRQLTTFLGRDIPRREATDLADCCSDVLSLMAGDLRREGIQLERCLEPTRPVMIDRGQMRQVILNLLINARHALIDRPEKRLGVRTREHADRVLIEISDSGPGIPAAIRDKVFLPFFSTKGERATMASPWTAVKGVGLGLSVSQRIVHNHGGSIGFHGTPDGGTVFTVELPAEPAARSRGRADAGGAPRILVLDDEPIVRQVLCDVLNDHGFMATSEEDGERALELTRQEPLDLLIVDLQMPGMGGMEFIRRLSANADGKPAPRLLIMTGQMDLPDDQLLRELHVAEVLSKPADVGTLVDAVKRILEN